MASVPDKPTGVDTHTHTHSHTRVEATEPESAPAAPVPSDPEFFPARLVLPDNVGELRLETVPFLEASMHLRESMVSHYQACMFTSYRFELDVPGLDAPIVLSEFTDLTPHADRLVPTGAAPTPAVIRVVPENYDVHRARAHVRAFRDVLARPPVVSPLLADLEMSRVGKDEPAAAGAPSQSEPATAPNGEAGEGGAADDEGTGQAASEADADTADERAPEAMLSRVLDDSTTGMNLVMAVQLQRSSAQEAQKKVATVSIPVVPDLGMFYPSPLPTRLMEEVAYAKDPEATAGFNAAENPADNTALLLGPYARGLAGAALPQCVRSITYSGWNPPPASRRMMGDFFYLRVETLSARVLHITANPLGFYVNRTSDDSGFDPMPATPSYSSRTLWALMARACPMFKPRYQMLISRAISNAMDAVKNTANQWDAAFILTLQQDMANLGMFAGSDTDPSTGGAVLRAPQLLRGVGAGFTPASTYGIAAAPAGPFALCKAPWLVPAPATPAGDAGVAGQASTAPAQKRRGRPAEDSGDASGSSAMLPSGARASTTSTVPGHSFDPARAEDDMLCTFGMNERGALRDWNEEWQACKELPANTLQERVVRARATAQVLCDFVDAATQGCMAIVQGHISSLDPAEDPRTHVYVYNNIFFSMVLDARTKETERRAKLLRERASGAGGAAAPPGAFDELASLASPNHDLQGVMALNKADVKGLHTLATAIVSYAGHRFVAQSIIPGILLAEAASRMVYGSVDNGATVASDPALHEKLRVAAAELHVAERTVMPLGKPKLLDTSAEGAAADAVEAVQPSRSGLAQKSCAAETPVPFIGPVECKGIQGSDERYYILDCVRFTPRDPIFYDKALAAWRTRMEKAASEHPADADECSAVFDSAYSALLRPELLHLYQAYRRLSAASRAEEAQVAAANGGSEANPSSTAPVEPVQPLQLNVNVFTRFSKTMPAEERARDEAAVREVAVYLTDIVIPHMFHEWRIGNGVPLEGESLTRQLHQKGINVRYLGMMADMAFEAEQRMSAPPYLLELFETEMVARVSRRMLDNLLRDNPACKAAPAVTIATFLSALLGAPPTEAQLREQQAAAAAAAAVPLTASQKKKQKKAAKAAAAGGAPAESVEGAAPVADPEPVIPTAMAVVSGATLKFPANDVPNVADVCRKALFDAGITHNSLWAEIAREVDEHFGCQLRLWARGGSAAKADGPAPEGSALGQPERTHRLPLLRRICQRSGVQLVARTYDWNSTSPVTPDDVAGLVPVVKSCLPSTLLPDAAMLQQEARSLMESRPLRAFDKVQEATSLINHVLGSTSKDLAYNCQLAAMLLNIAGEHHAALQQQQNAVLLYERLTGPDSPDTAHAHNVLGSYLSAVGAANAAIRHTQRSLYLFSLMAPTSHPELSTLYARLAVIYQSYFHIPMAIRCFFEALRIRYDAATQMSYGHALALAFAHLGNFREALRWERRVQQFYQEKLGEDSELYQEATFFVTAFTKKAVEMERAVKTLTESSGTSVLLGDVLPGADESGASASDASAPAAGEKKSKSSKNRGKKRN